jgi:uncharacterized membrane protein
MVRKKFPSLAESAATRRKSIRSFKAKANERRSVPEKIADFLATESGTMPFLLFNILGFSFWLLWNTGRIPGLVPLDPFPFGLLTTVVSLEAIFLAIIVLISQNREARIADLREEVELYISTHAENEITKLMYLVTLLLKKQGIDVSADMDIQEMLEVVDSDAIEREFEKQLTGY